MQKWEYLEIGPALDAHIGYIVAKNNGEDVLRQKIPFYEYINKLGEEGWELVSNADCHYIFKRPKTSP